MSRTASRARVVAAALVLGSCVGASDPWVADVDGVQLRRSALLASVESRVQNEPQRDRKEIILEELERMVNEQVILNRAHALGIEITDADVEARLASLFGDQTFMADREYREEVRREMLLDRAALVDLADQIHVSETEIALHFQEHRKSFGTPPRVQIRQIVVQDRALARRLLGELRDGADFDALAREWSVAPEAREGGLLPPFAKGELPEVFDAAFKQRPGRLSDVLESPFGFHIFRLERRIPAHEATLDESRAAIRESLEQKRLSEARRRWRVELRNRASIRVNEPVLETLS
ncbi:MAG: peptidylprolyl isomerase [Myxococcota bacterium]